MADQGPPRITSFLVVRLGVETERVIIWDTLEITVGRLDTQDIVVPDPEVSRRHAVLQRGGQDFLVEDLGSPLRTLVNGEPIKTQQLAAGDLITIGLLELQFGQTTDPDSLPVKSYAHPRQCPGGIRRSRRQATIVGTPISARGIQSGM